MLPVLDFGSKLTVNNTAYNSTNTYTYIPPSGLNLLLEEISVSADSALISDGRMQMFIAGVPFTSKGGASVEIPLLAGFSAKYDVNVPFIVERGATLSVAFRTTSSTGSAQVQLIGKLLNDAELERLRAKYGV